jgi:hypothetical protein
MARKRLRDWPLRVYKYWANPTTIPQEIWDTAKEMQLVWNKLVEIRQVHFPPLPPREPGNGNEEQQPKIPQLTSEEKKAKFEAFDLACRDFVDRSRLNWECKAEILDRFQTASRKAFKEGATLRFQRRLERVLIPHRFTGGGVPLEKIFFEQKEGTKNKSWRIAIPPVDPKMDRLTHHPRMRACYKKGTFGLAPLSLSRKYRGEEEVKKPITFQLHTLITRQIPADAIVKKVLWAGNYISYRKEWKWSLQIVVEEKPVYPERWYRGVRQEATLGRGGLTAGLDLGWRLINNRQDLRIGVLCDNMGKTIELRLPIEWKTGTSRKLVKHTYCFQTFRDLISLDERIGHALQSCKDDLKELFPSLPLGFVKMRQSGLMKLLRQLETPEQFDLVDPSVADLPWRTHQEIVGRIKEWLVLDQEYWKIKGCVSELLLNRRRHLYENMCNWLTRTYQCIVWEGELGVKRMREDHSNPALENAKKHSNWAAIGEFRRILKQSAVKNACLLVDGPTVNSTRANNRNQEELTEPTGNEFLEFSDGYRVQQDQNSAKNLLSVAPDFQSEPYLGPAPMDDFIRPYIVDLTDLLQDKRAVA